MKPFQIRHSLAAIALFAALAVCSCDYPQAGYYALVGLNRTGEQVFFQPFVIEEIIDDSEMTTGFMLLLPNEGQLVEVPVANSQDTSRRSWNFGISTEDTLAGNLDLALTHYNGVLKFSGEYQALPTLPPWPVSGRVDSDARSSWLEFSGGLPYLHESLSNVFRFELVEISAAEIVTVLGCPIAEASRVEQSPVTMEVVEIRPEPGLPPPAKPLPPPTPPARGTSGRR